MDKDQLTQNEYSLKIIFDAAVCVFLVFLPNICIEFAYKYFSTVRRILVPTVEVYLHSCPLPKSVYECMMNNSGICLLKSCTCA